MIHKKRRIHKRKVKSKLETLKVKEEKGKLYILAEASFHA